MLTRLKKEAVAAESVGSIKEWRESAAEICEFVGHGQDMSPFSTGRHVGQWESSDLSEQSTPHTGATPSSAHLKLQQKSREFGSRLFGLVS